MNKDDLILEDDKEYVEVSMDELFKIHLYSNGLSSHDAEAALDSIKIPISDFIDKTVGRKAFVPPGNKTIH